MPWSSRLSPRWNTRSASPCCSCLHTCSAGGCTRRSFRRLLADPIMLLGYNTNGLAHHDPFDALTLLAEIGYQSVAITLDHGPLNPLASDWPANLKRLKGELRRVGLRSVVETGARFLLNPRLKHEPTLVSAAREDRQIRMDFLRRAIDAAAYLESDCVSLWSGTR